MKPRQAANLGIFFIGLYNVVGGLWKAGDNFSRNFPRFGSAEFSEIMKIGGIWWVVGLLLMLVPGILLIIYRERLAWILFPNSDDEKGLERKGTLSKDEFLYAIVAGIGLWMLLNGAINLLTSAVYSLEYFASNTYKRSIWIVLTGLSSSAFRAVVGLALIYRTKSIITWILKHQD